MKQCAICKKGSIIRGARKKLRGNYNPTKKNRKRPNLQKTTYKNEHILACTQCIKTLNRKAA